MLPVLSRKVVHTFKDDGPDCYVLGCTSNSEDLLATSAHSGKKNDVIKLYQRSAMTLIAQLKGHKKSVSDLSFSNEDPNVLCTSSNDGTVKLWDCRAASETHNFADFKRESMEANCCSIRGPLVAGGGEALVLLWDMRNPLTPLRRYEDLHTESVTQVRFHPTQAQFFCTASVDGLVCCVNPEVEDTDEAINGVLNADVSISKIGYFGPYMEFVYATTHVEGIAAWNLITGDRICNIFDARPNLSPPGKEVNYLIDCKHLPETNQLMILAGTDDGDLVFGQFLADGNVVSCGSLTGGHTELIRDFDWNTKDQTLITCAEDSHLAVWKWGLGAAAAASGSPAVERSQKHKQAFTPY